MKKILITIMMLSSTYVRADLLDLLAQRQITKHGYNDARLTEIVSAEYHELWYQHCDEFLQDQLAPSTFPHCPSFNYPRTESKVIMRKLAEMLLGYLIGKGLDEGAERMERHVERLNREADAIKHDDPIPRPRPQPSTTPDDRDTGSRRPVYFPIIGEMV